MIRFKFADVQQELIAIRSLSKDYIEDASQHFVLRQFETLLVDIQKRGGKGCWEIREKHPLVTRRSVGEYEPGGKKGLHVFATISCIWEITCVGGAPKKVPATHFEITGKASTKVRIWRALKDGATTPIAMWRMEIGDRAAPGCHFHVQVLGETDDGQFPKSLPVPRLPGLPATPLLVIEYVLAELFQDEWRQTTGKKSDELTMWRGIQSERFQRFFGWQQDAVKGLKSGSPWTALKLLKPDVDMFGGS
ncbi:MAG: hypothetical protein M3P30_16410 [Chloroflexota bacterium]|nr:hypothetical protein [Chloroflexota bacterium]